MRSKKNRWIISLLWMTLAAFLAGCGEAAAPETIDTPTEAAQPTSTMAPSRTATPTLTLTPTYTPTETSTFTPTPAYNLPGTYEILRCVSFKPFASGWEEGVAIRFCLQTVKVREDGTMQTNVTWTYNYHSNTYASGPIIIKTGFLRTVLIDDLENVYETIDMGGAAANMDKMEPGKTIAGWYLFDRPEPGATSFRLLDLDSRISIDDIVLLPDPNAPTLTPTPTLDLNLEYNAPGSYYIYQCEFLFSPAGIPGAQRAKMCLVSIIVEDDYRMKFNFTWTVYFEYAGTATKESEAEDEGIQVEDDLGNIYRPVETGGCADQSTVLFTPMDNGDASCGGWFLFPPAEPDATIFRYTDPKNEILFDNIILVNPGG
jgi:hypothetical protein